MHEFKGEYKKKALWPTTHTNPTHAKAMDFLHRLSHRNLWQFINEQNISLDFRFLFRRKFPCGRLVVVVERNEFHLWWIFVLTALTSVHSIYIVILVFLFVVVFFFSFLDFLLFTEHRNT